MSLLGKLFEAGKGKLDNLQQHTQIARSLSDDELVRTAKRKSGMEKAPYLQEVKRRGLEHELL